MELEVSAIDPKTIEGGGGGWEGRIFLGLVRVGRRAEVQRVGGELDLFKGLGRVAAGGGLQRLLPAGQGATAFVEQILAVVYVLVILQRQVPAVQVVHVLEGAPRPSSSTGWGRSCCAAEALKQSRFHRCSSWVRLSCPLLCNDSPGVETVQKTVEVPQFVLIDKGFP